MLDRDVLVFCSDITHTATYETCFIIIVIIIIIIIIIND